MNTTIKRPNAILWLADHRGRYIPRDFANSFADRAKIVSGISDKDWSILESGPDHEFYWDTWDTVCSDAIVTDENGYRFKLYQDGTLWLVPEGMEWFGDDFVWPDEQQEEVE